MLPSPPIGVKISVAALSTGGAHGLSPRRGRRLLAHGEPAMGQPTRIKKFGSSPRSGSRPYPASNENLPRIVFNPVLVEERYHLLAENRFAGGVPLGFERSALPVMLV